MEGLVRGTREKVLYYFGFFIRSGPVSLRSGGGQREREEREREREREREISHLVPSGITVSLYSPV